MKALAHDFSMTRTLVLASAVAALAAPPLARGALPCAAASPAMPPELVAQAAQANAYPTFCAIPPVPTDVRSAGAFKAEVVEIRVLGARVVREGAQSGFSLGGTDDFANLARTQASPPPPMTSPEDAGTDAFTSEMRAKATPPPRPR
jgi:hypothetical protein